ncbi:diguanylate cyclase [Methylobacterium durans]|uniref:diguanylate cyclase domain-containing protein n=1 Tax=Methylobacterium durans TaxID=2202825 RepID=UPI002AFF1639|nr:diguanylate cyclase [Methylobacterium durans]MEA1833578.1 diguanylate cyclase [Methylobacterium durans]
MSQDPVSAVAIAPDRLRARLHAEAARLARLGAWECDLATERLTWTEGVYDLFGLEPGAPLRRPEIVGRYEEASRGAMERLRAEAIRTGRGFVLDALIRPRRGEERWIRIGAELARDGDGRPARLYGYKQDVTAEREALERLRHLAERDHLTGLANRAAFDARCRAVAAAGQDRGGVAGLVLIDLDRFKAINDTLGHAAGDACLRAAAERLGQAFADASLVARIGGDEFAVLLRAPLGRGRILRMLAGASAALSRPVLWNGALLAVSASIGARILDPGRDRAPGSGLFAEADAALYAAKAAGRNAVRIFGAAEARAASG